ncbi:FxsA family protein [Mumia zhuanghuii]|uniref:FxsA family protein n=2 Tax=Mumia TaxID=1546255 RepID=A0ABW1QLY4_9ACTN|nr:MULTISPECIES: FxsA family protein [Mumia]KAA1419876.1 FxsA family protein [Mumia zhuanghuii]
MRRGIAAAFLLLPVVEIAIAVGVASLIGVGPTLLALLVLSVIGVMILRIAGRRKLEMLRAAASDGVVPPVDGGRGPSAIAGILLAVPGFLTALVGLLLLVPPVRRLAARRTRRWAESNGSWVVMDSFRRPAAGRGPVTPGTPAAGTVVQGEVVDDR